MIAEQLDEMSRSAEPTPEGRGAPSLLLSLSGVQVGLSGTLRGLFALQHAVAFERVRDDQLSRLVGVGLVEELE